MNNFVQDSITFGAVISIFFYLIGMWIKKRLKWPLFNPLLLAIIFVIVFLKLFRVDYDNYYSSAKYLSYLLTPATVSLAIPLYMQIDKLRKHYKAILISILAGTLMSLLAILLMSVLFHLSHQEYVTMLPKSITTAIGISVSEELGGYATITAAAIILTGILGNSIAEPLCRAMHITEPVAKGLAIGTASHAIGTAKAMEMGETEGAMSSLAIVICGIMTVIGAPVFAMFF
ncbi:MAG: LrgB family protein [Lachnospiraceae bacterium]|nr:LrgB family protein [Lachnospiraceae bacterium]